MIVRGLTAAASRVAAVRPVPLRLEVIVPNAFEGATQAPVLDAGETPPRAPETDAGADAACVEMIADAIGPVYLDVGGDVVRIDRIGGAYRVPSALVEAFRVCVGIPADA